MIKIKITSKIKNNKRHRFYELEHLVKNFAITGIAGYVAPRHLQAIKDTGNKLAAAFDPHDSVGILDDYFPDARFFTEYERFERYLDKLKRGPEKDRIHYLTICSPNYVHDTHIRLALKIGADVICEKPVVINPWNLDGLEQLEKETNSKIYTILQLRLHPLFTELKESLQKQITTGKHEVELNYITSRGKWYDFSWKGSEEKSGGLATNIGIHLFDLVIWLFGECKESKVFLSGNRKMRGYLELENANVEWFLSIDKDDLPVEIINSGQNTYRSMKIDGKEFEFSKGFTDLHLKSYEEILKENGFGLKDARPSIELVHQIRVKGKV